MRYIQLRINASFIYMFLIIRLFTIILILNSNITMAGEADVLAVNIRPLGEDSFSIDATVQHADTGWDHYTNSWEVLDLDGNLLGKRVLLHPHVDEQPFTRNLVLTIPQNVKTIMIRANDVVHGKGSNSLSASVPR